MNHVGFHGDTSASWLLGDDVDDRDATIAALRAENTKLREALGYTIATIDNVLPTLAEIDDEDEAKEVEEHIDEYRKLLTPTVKGAPST